jgi:GNAT superfamily N-acetyltransferase
MITIREYRPDDRNRTLRCIAALHDYERDIESTRAPGDSVAQQYLTYLLDQNAAKRGELFVALRDDTVVGFVNVWIDNDDDPASGEGVHGYCADIFVDATVRRSGVGRQLMKKVESYIHTLGVKTLICNVLSSNSVMRQALQKGGFSEYETTFRKILP